MKYKNILTGVHPHAGNWLDALKRINKPNCFICDFADGENLERTIIENHIDIVLPLSKSDFDSAHRHISEEQMTHDMIIYPRHETVQILDNKLTFTLFMIEHFHDFIPTVYFLDNVQLHNVEYPVITKPIFSTNGVNMKVYHNEEEFATCHDRIIIQRFIEDQNEYAAYMLCIDGRIITWKVIRGKFDKYHIKTTNFSPNSYEILEKFDIDLFEPIVRKLNYSGGMCINFKFNEDTQKIDIFEMNPRFGGSAFTNDFIYDLLCIEKTE